MELKHEKITQWIPDIFLVVMNGDMKLQVIVVFVVFRPCMCTYLSIASST